jgi:hypothetical protein
MKKPQLILILKCVVAVLALGALAAFIGSRMSPETPTWTLLGRVAGAVLIGGAVLVGLIFIQLSWGQAMLRRGARDPQWYWFKGDPPGVEQVRPERPERKE